MNDAPGRLGMFSWFSRRVAAAGGPFCNTAFELAPMWLAPMCLASLAEFERSSSRLAESAEIVSMALRRSFLRLSNSEPMRSRRRSSPLHRCQSNRSRTSGNRSIHRALDHVLLHSVSLRANEGC